MQIGEEDLAAAQAAVFLRLRLLDLEDQLGALPELVDVVDQLGAGVAVVLVRGAGADAGPRLHEDLVACAHQLLDPALRQGHTELVVLHFGGHGDQHAANLAHPARSSEGAGAAARSRCRRHRGARPVILVR